MSTIVLFFVGNLRNYETTNLLFLNANFSLIKIKQVILMVVLMAKNC